MDDKNINKKMTEESIRTIINSKILTVSFLAVILIFFPAQVYSSNVTTTPSSPNGISNTLPTADTSITQTIEQIATQIANANPGADAGQITQNIEQLASQSAQAGGAIGDVNQILSQIANQVAENPTGQIAQNILQSAQQIATTGTSNAPAPAGVGDINQQITQIANQIATATGADTGTVSQIIDQLASQIAEGGANTNQIISQFANQAAQNPDGLIAQSIAQLAKQHR